MRLGILPFVLLLAACVTSPERRHVGTMGSPIAMWFARTAFVSDIGEKRVQHELWRWETAPVVTLLSSDGWQPERTEKYLNWAIDDIASTGLPIRRDDSGPADIMVVIAEEEGRFAAARDAAVEDEGNGCWTAVEADPSGAIRSATVFIRSDLRFSARDYCLVRGMGRAAGLTGSIAPFDNSALDNKSGSGRLGYQVRQLLMILYDPRLRSGLRPAEAMPIVDQIIAERGWRAGRQWDPPGANRRYIRLPP